MKSLSAISWSLNRVAGSSVFEELFPSRRPALYRAAASDAGFRSVPGDVESDPDAAELVSVHGEMYNCMVGTLEGRRVAIFENIFGAPHQAVIWNIAFDIGQSEFRETTSLGSYWNMRRAENWVYFEALIEFNQYPNFKDFLRETSEMLDLCLL